MFLLTDSGVSLFCRSGNYLVAQRAENLLDYRAMTEQYTVAGYKS